jgi:hypothetical protein
LSSLHSIKLVKRAQAVLWTSASRGWFLIAVVIRVRGCHCTRVQWVMVGNISHKCGHMWLHSPMVGTMVNTFKSMAHVHWTISSTSCLRQNFCADIDNWWTKMVTFLVCSLIVRVNYWMNHCCHRICSSGYCSTWV